MNERQPPARHLPILTEVVADDAIGVPEQPAAPTTEDERQLVERVLSDVQRQLDLLLEQRLREMLAPILARLADGLLEDGREQLTLLLRELVERAVSQELERQRKR